MGIVAPGRARLSHPRNNCSRKRFGFATEPPGIIQPERAADDRPPLAGWVAPCACCATNPDLKGRGFCKQDGRRCPPAFSVSELLRIGLADPGIPGDRSRRIAAKGRPRRAADDHDLTVTAAANDVLKLLGREDARLNSPGRTVTLITWQIAVLGSTRAAVQARPNGPGGYRPNSRSREAASCRVYDETIRPL